MLDFSGIGGQKKGSALHGHPESHVNGKAPRKIVVRLPPEAGGGLGILLRSLCGTRDAAVCWEACIAEVRRKL